MPNKCPVCLESMWNGIRQKHMMCSICKALIHKKCINEQENMKNYPKCKNMPDASESPRLFGVHLERICQKGIDFIINLLLFN